MPVHGVAPARGTEPGAETAGAAAGGLRDTPPSGGRMVMLQRLVTAQARPNAVRGMTWNGARAGSCSTTTSAVSPTTTT